MDALNPRKQKLSEIVENVGQKMADAFVREVEVRTSQAWKRDLPEIKPGPASTVPPAPPGESPRAVARASDEPELTPTPRPTQPRPDASWGVRGLPAVAPVASLTPNWTPPVNPTQAFTQIPVAARPPARTVEGPSPGRPSPVGMASALPMSSPQPPAPLAPSPMAAPISAPEPFRLATDTFRQSAVPPMPAAGFSAGGGPRGGTDAPSWATELTAAIKELTREMGEADEDETEHGENAPRRDTGADHEPMRQQRSERILPTVTAWQERPTRPQPPMPSAGAPR